MKNKENRLKIGTPLLVLGPHFFEKAEVVSVENGIFTLNNKIKVTNELVITNNSKMQIKSFDEEEYNFLVAKNKIPRVLEKIENKYKELSKDDLIKLFDRLNRITHKYFEK